MLKVIQDFTTVAGQSFKNGDVIPPFTFEADDLYGLKLRGYVEDSLDSSEKAIKPVATKKPQGAKK